MIDSNIIEPHNEIKVIEEKFTNVQVDSQILSTFMSCACKADYVFNRHLIPVSGMSKSIEKGQLAHVGLHAYGKARIEGKDYQEAITSAMEITKLESVKMVNLEADDALQVYSTLIEYFKHISGNVWTYVFVEQHFKFIAYEDPISRLRIILTGRIDLGMRTQQGMLIPIDYKTESERWFHTQMSNQFKIYALACKSNVLGVQRFGFQKTLKPEDKFKLELLPFDPDILEEFRTVTLPHWCRELIKCRETGYWPMNTTNCIHGHFACQFSDKYNGGICNVSRQVREQKLERYFKVGEEWNPQNV